MKPVVPVTDVEQAADGAGCADGQTAGDGSHGLGRAAVVAQHQDCGGGAHVEDVADGGAGDFAPAVLPMSV